LILIGLVDEVKEKSNLDISIFAPTCDLGKCDISENNNNIIVLQK
jgi:hypothetical protein